MKRANLTKARLRSLLSKVSHTGKRLEPVPVSLSSSLKKYVNRIQLKDVYPNILFFNQGRGSFIARVGGR